MELGGVDDSPSEHCKRTIGGGSGCTQTGIQCRSGARDFTNAVGVTKEEQASIQKPVYFFEKLPEKKGRILSEGD